jgi:hypothetical protein
LLIYIFILHLPPVDSIGTLSSANKRNDGQGSLLHLWGKGDVYGTLPTGQFSCSIETDCNDSIYVISMDFRFQNVSGNCPDENTISIMDDRMTTFTCTSNNNFVIQQLYSSNRHYITLTYDGNTAGGYLWLTFICEYKNTENSNKKGLKDRQYNSKQKKDKKTNKKGLKIPKG